MSNQRLIRKRLEEQGHVFYKPLIETEAEKKAKLPKPPPVWPFKCAGCGEGVNLMFGGVPLCPNCRKKSDIDFINVSKICIRDDKDHKECK